MGNELSWSELSITKSSLFDIDLLTNKKDTLKDNPQMKVSIDENVKKVGFDNKEPAIKVGKSTTASIIH